MYIPSDLQPVKPMTQAPNIVPAKVPGGQQIVPAVNAFPAVKTRPTARAEHLRMRQGHKLLKQCLRAWREAEDVAASVEPSSEDSSSSGDDTDGDVEKSMRARAVAPVSDQPLWQLVKEQGERSTRQEEQIIMLTKDLDDKNRCLDALRTDNNCLFVDNQELLKQQRLLEMEKSACEYKLATSEAKVAELERHEEAGTLAGVTNAPSYDELKQDNNTLRGFIDQLNKKHAEEIADLRESLSENEQYERYESDMMNKNKQIQDLITTLEATQRAKNASDELFAVLKRECNDVKQKLTALQSAAPARPSPPLPAPSLPPPPPPPPPPGGGPPPPPPPPPQSPQSPAASGVTRSIAPSSAASRVTTPIAPPAAPAGDMMDELRRRQEARQARIAENGSIDGLVQAQKQGQEVARNEANPCGVNPSDMLGHLQAGVKARRPAVEGEEFVEWSDDE